MTSSNYPPSLLSQAKCIAVIPDLTNAGFIFGGKHGGGAVGCRTASSWGVPASITMSGGSVGLRASAEHQDVVLLMNQQGADELKSGHWDLGGEAGAQAPVEGKKQPKAPVGRRRCFLIPIPAHLFHAPTRTDQTVGTGPDKDAIHNGLRQRHFVSGDAPWPSATTGICTTVSVCRASDRREQPLK